MVPALRAILVVDHGSRRAEANEVARSIASKLAARTGALVAHAHLELAAPDIARAIADLAARGATELVVLPLFLTPGRHLAADVPRLVAEAARASGVSVRSIEAAIGDDDALVALLAARIPD